MVTQESHLQRAFISVDKEQMVKMLVKNGFSNAILRHNFKSYFLQKKSALKREFFEKGVKTALNREFFKKCALRGFRSLSSSGT